MLSAFLDDELTQADSQRVRLHLDECQECRHTLEEMKKLQQLTSEMKFRNPPEEMMEALEQRISVQAPRITGWWLIIISVLSWFAYLIVLVIRNPRWPTIPELLEGGFGAGLLLLFLSVLRQRILERPHDRYRKVRR